MTQANIPQVHANEEARDEETKTNHCDEIVADESAGDVCSDTPEYFIEYAPNNRAKCKSCDVKLVKDELRIGVRILHTKYGRTTYYKHLACTKLFTELCGQGPEYRIQGMSDLHKRDQTTVRKRIESPFTFTH